MPMLVPLWGFIGLFAGAWKLAIVGGVLVALFGRTLRPYAFRRISSFLGIEMPAAAKPPPPSPRRSRFNDRVFLFLMVIAVTVVASLILGRVWIMQTMSGTTSASTRSSTLKTSP